MRGKQKVKVTHLHQRFIGKLRDIALSSGSLESQAEFQKAPRGATFSHVSSYPFRPQRTAGAAGDRKFPMGSSLEKAYYDDDLLAADAVGRLHERGLPFSSIEKAFSLGSFGIGKRRRLVPTRWAITADSTLARRLLHNVRGYQPIDCVQVREFSSLNNYYAVLLLPTAWQYEWMEAFLHILGGEELIFSDYENNGGKKGYSRVGGCYYSCKMAVLEALAREKSRRGP